VRAPRSVRRIPAIRERDGDPIRRRPGLLSRGAAAHRIDLHAQLIDIMSNPPVTPGQRFRDTHPSLFGRLGSEWIVQDAFIGTDDIWYARLAHVSDPAERKTLSTAVLGDRRRFVSV
jgi:hypothetical protein